MSPLAVRVDTEGPVAVVTIDRPEVANAVDRPTAAALADAFRNEYDHGMATLATGETFTGVGRYVALRQDRADSAGSTGRAWADATSTRKRSI